MCDIWCSWTVLLFCGQIFCWCVGDFILFLLLSLCSRACANFALLAEFSISPIKIANIGVRSETFAESSTSVSIDKHTQTASLSMNPASKVMNWDGERIVPYFGFPLEYVGCVFEHQVHCLSSDICHLWLFSLRCWTIDTFTIDFSASSRIAKSREAHERRELMAEQNQRLNKNYWLNTKSDWRYQDQKKVFCTIFTNKSVIETNTVKPINNKWVKRCVILSEQNTHTQTVTLSIRIPTTKGNRKQNKQTGPRKCFIFCK